MLREKFSGFFILPLILFAQICLSLGNSEVFAKDPHWFESPYYDRYGRREVCGRTPFTCKQGELQNYNTSAQPPSSHKWKCGNTDCYAPIEGCNVSKPNTAPRPQCAFKDADGNRRSYLCAVGLPAPQPGDGTSYRWICYNEIGQTRSCSSSFR